MFEKIKAIKERKKKLEDASPKVESFQELEILERAKAEITVLKEGDLIQVNISDYISPKDYYEEMKDCDIYSLLGNAVLWCSDKRAINKGIYYILQQENILYNIRICDDEVNINQRITLEESVYEKDLYFKFDQGVYWYSSLKHDLLGDTLYVKYYTSKDYNYYGLGLEKEKAKEEMKILFEDLQEELCFHDILQLSRLEQIVCDSFQNANVKIK